MWYLSLLLSTIAKGTYRCINQVINEVIVVTIENIHIYCLPLAIFAIMFKAHCPGDHPLIWRGVLPSQPTSCTGATVISSNRSVNHLGSSLACDAIPTISPPLWSNILISCLITTPGVITKVSLVDQVVSCGGVQDIIVFALFGQNRNWAISQSRPNAAIQYFFTIRALRQESTSLAEWPTLRGVPGVPGAFGVPGTQLLTILFSGDFSQDVNQVLIIKTASNTVRASTRLWARDTIRALVCDFSSNGWKKYTYFALWVL